MIIRQKSRKGSNLDFQNLTRLFRHQTKMVQAIGIESDFVAKKPC